MSTSIRSTCTACGPIEVPIAAAELMLDPDAVTGDARNMVVFDCPQCSLPGNKQVDERAVRLLLAAGVEVVVSPRRSGEVPAGQAPRETRFDRS